MKALSLRILLVCLLSMSLGGLLRASESAEEKAFLALERIEEEAETSLDTHLRELSGDDLERLFKFHQNCRLGHLQETLFGFASEYPQPIDLRNKKSTFALYWRYVFYELGAYPRFGRMDEDKAEALQVSDLMFRKKLKFKHAFKIVRKLRATQGMPADDRFHAENRIFANVLFPHFFSDISESDVEKLLVFNSTHFSLAIRKPITLRSEKACSGLLMRYVLFKLGAYPRTEDMDDYLKEDAEEIIDLSKNYKLELADAIACMEKLDAYKEWREGTSLSFYGTRYLNVFALCAQEKVAEVKFEDLNALSDLVKVNRERFTGWGYTGWRSSVATRSAVQSVREHCEELGFCSSDAASIVGSFRQGEGMGATIHKNLWRIVSRRFSSIEGSLIEASLPVWVPTAEIKSYPLLKREDVVGLWQKLPWDRLLARVTNGGCSSTICGEVMSHHMGEKYYRLEEFLQLHTTGCATFHFLAEENKKKKKNFEPVPMDKIRFYERVLHLNLDEFKQVYDKVRYWGRLSESIGLLLLAYTGEFTTGTGELIEGVKEQFKTLVMKEKLSLAEAAQRLVRPVIKAALPSLGGEARDDLIQGQFCQFGFNAVNPVGKGLSRFVASRFSFDAYIADVVSWAVKSGNLYLEPAVEKVKDHQVMLEKWRDGNLVSAENAGKYMTRIKKVPDSFASKSAKHLLEIINAIEQIRSDDVQSALEIFYYNSRRGYPQVLATVLAKKTVEEDIAISETNDLAAQEYVRLRLPHLADQDLKTLLLYRNNNYTFDWTSADSYTSRVLRDYFDRNAIQRNFQPLWMMLVKDQKMGLSQADDTCMSIAPYLKIYKEKLTYNRNFYPECYLTDAELLKASIEAAKLEVEVGKNATIEREERIEYGFWVVTSSWDTFAQEKWMADSGLRAAFRKHVVARVFNDVKRFAPYYPNPQAKRDGDFSHYERALAQFWCEHKFATTLVELRQQGAVDLDNIWRQNFTDTQKQEFAKIWFYLMPEGALDFSKRSKEKQLAIFTDLLVIYYSHVEPMEAHPMLNFNKSNYVKGLVTKMLEEDSESVPLLNSLAHTAVEQQAQDLRRDYPYLEEKEVVHLVQSRVMRKEDPLKQMLQVRCAEVVFTSRKADAELYRGELVDWIMDHTERSFEEAVASFHQFLAEEQQEYQDRGWGFLPQEYEQLVWDVRVRQWSVSEALYRPVNRVVVQGYQRLLIDNPLGLSGRGKPMKPFVEELCVFMIDKNLRGPLADIILGPYRKKIIEDQIDQTIAFPRSIKAAIVADIVDRKVEPLQAVARQVRVVTGLVFPKAEFNPDGWLRRMTGFQREDCIDADREQVKEGHYSLSIAQLMLYGGQSYARGLVLGYLDRFVDYSCEAYASLRDDTKVIQAFAAIRMRQISREDYDLPKDYVLNVHRETEFAFQLAQRAISEADIHKMYPVELICLFRETLRVMPQSVYAYREALGTRVKAGAEAARTRFEVYVKSCYRLDNYHPGLSDHAWNWDGRNPKFIGILDKCLPENMYMQIPHAPGDGRLSVNRLRYDPFLKPSDLDKLMPHDIGDAVFFAMRDELIGLTQVHLQRAHCKKELEEVRATKEKVYKETANKSLKAFFKWGAIGAFDPKQKVLTPDQGQYRRRIALVYNRLFKPMIDTKNYGELMGLLTNIFENGLTCVDACRKALVALEERPEVGLFAIDKPDLFERLAIVLRESRMICVRKVALQRAKTDKNEKEEIEFEFFLTSVLRAHMSLGGFTICQLHGGCAQYGEDKLRADTNAVALLYLKNIVEYVTAAISHRAMPAGDRNGNVIYLEQVVAWAEKTPWYCNKMDLDVELLDGNKPKPIVVRRLLQDAGYLEEDK